MTEKPLEHFQIPNAISDVRQNLYRSYIPSRRAMCHRYGFCVHVQATFESALQTLWANLSSYVYPLYVRV